MAPNTVPKADFRHWQVRVYHVIYIVPSDGKTFLINMNCSEGLASEYVAVFGKIADSITAKLP